MIDNGSISTDWAGSYRYAGNLIIGSGTFRSQNSDQNNCNNLTIATGATLDADNDTITVAGDFTTSGGLLGASCLTLNGSDEFVDVTALSTDPLAAISAEAWILTSYSGGNQRIISNRSNDNFEFGVVSNKVRLEINTASSNQVFSGATTVNDGKWHHVAVTYDGSTAKIYVDGKLDAQNTTVGGNLDSAVDAIYIGKYGSGEFFNGSIDEVRLFSDARTESELRADMFQGGTLANSGALVGRWSCNEGTGSAVADSSGNSNNGVASDAGGAELTGLWAGAGTFTYGTSTLTMTGSSKSFNITGNESFYNLVVNGTLTINDIDGNNSQIRVYGDTFTMGGSATLTSTASEEVKLFTGGTTATFGAASTNIANLYKLQCTHTSGTISISACTTPRLFGPNNGGTTTATGDLTITQELQIDSGHTFNANGNTIACKTLDVNGGTLDLSNSTMNFSVTNSGDDLSLSTSSTLLTGNTTLLGHSSATPTPTTMGSAGNFEVVGDVSNLALQGGGDLTVIGSVTNCTLADSTANIRQWHHTLDTQQLLDADEAGDDDLRLTKPALDNAHELMTG